ncbi:MAG TPA: phenylalanine--tRNA ligase subunit beta, partial [Pyrinomonadaceae bacterium]|nr:phenylalanine--tRNA ligase subunit beta [Pyrinomonadaceae bacterium]
MLISYRWLNDLFPTDLLPEAIAEKLTGIGHAVDGLEALGDDWIIDLDLTSNRPDCLSHLGIARELAASLNTKLSANKRLSKSNLEALPYPAILAPEVVKIEAPDLCHRFTARIIRGVKVGPSPDWLKRRLESVGERSINNIADITNYVMLELGQPMHAFDLDKLSGSKIIVRRARPGEKLKTLDGVERLLDEDILCVCDDEKPAAIAGIMGGEYSSITDATVNVLLEVAYFLPGVVRQGSRSLNLRSEASNRFERGVDIENIENASQRATDMILDLAGGEAADLIDIYPNRHSPKTVCAPDLSESVKRLTSITVSEQECIEILGNLGIEKSQENDCYHIPSWRYDISIEEDLVEEVARITGYDKVRDELPPALHSGEYLPNEDF